RDKLRAEKIAQDRLFNNPKIKTLWNKKVVGILGVGNGEGGMPGMTGARLEDVNTGAQEDIAADGLFVAIGHDPATELFKGKLDMDEGGYLITKPDSTATNVAGVYAAGDVKDKVF